MRGILTLATVLAIATAGAFAQTTYNDVSNGDWDAAGTWTPAGGPPGAGDTGVIDSNRVRVFGTVDTTLRSESSGVIDFWGNGSGDVDGTGQIIGNGGIIGSQNNGSSHDLWNQVYLPITFQADTSMGLWNGYRLENIALRGAISGTAGVTVTIEDVLGDDETDNGSWFLTNASNPFAGQWLVKAGMLSSSRAGSLWHRHGHRAGLRRVVPQAHGEHYGRHRRQERRPAGLHRRRRRQHRGVDGPGQDAQHPGRRHLRQEAG
jgi:hypothetical protein